MAELFFDFLFVSLVLSINLVAIVLDTYLLSHPQLLQQFRKLPSFIQKQAVTFVVAPLFISPLLPQLRFDVSPMTAIPMGIILMIIGIALVWGAFTKIGVVPAVRQKSILLTTGVYGLVRHPIYSGTLLAFLGLNLAFKALIALLYWPFTVLLHLVMVTAEERLLETEYGEEYASYRFKVKGRLIPFIL